MNHAFTMKFIHALNAQFKGKPLQLTENTLYKSIYGTAQRQLKYMHSVHR